jgi:hypothetical protein
MGWEWTDWAYLADECDIKYTITLPLNAILLLVIVIVRRKRIGIFVHRIVVFLTEYVVDDRVVLRRCVLDELTIVFTIRIALIALSRSLPENLIVVLPINDVARPAVFASAARSFVMGVW